MNRVRNAKLKKLIEKLSKVTGYSIQKSVLFLYTNNKLSERAIKQTIPFIIVSKRIKQLGINLNKEIKDLYSENYEILIKKNVNVINKWKENPCSWTNKYC